MIDKSRYKYKYDKRCYSQEWLEKYPKSSIKLPIANFLYKIEELVLMGMSHNFLKWATNFVALKTHQYQFRSIV